MTSRLLLMFAALCSLALGACDGNTARELPGYELGVPFADGTAPAPVAPAEPDDAVVSVWECGDLVVEVNTAAFGGVQRASADAMLSRIESLLVGAGFEYQQTEPLGNVPALRLFQNKTNEEDDEDPERRPVRVFLLPGPDRTKAAIAGAWNERGLTNQPVGVAAGRLAHAAVTLLFEPRESGRKARLYIPSPVARPALAPGVARFGRPWLEMGRLVVCAAQRPDLVNPKRPNLNFQPVLQETLKKLGFGADGCVWSLPLNPVVSGVVYATESERRSWMAYAIADAVGPKRETDRGQNMPDGESRFTIPFDSSDRDPLGLHGHQLLRLPAASPRDPGGSVLLPGERVALDEPFAALGDGVTVLLHEGTIGSWGDESTTLSYVLTTGNIDDDQCDKIAVIAVFEGATNDRIAEVLGLLSEQE
ncbi:MAG: hypothetical protein AAGD00_00070 [Planctomycetota bacterium]